MLLLAEWRTTVFCSATWQHDCLKGKMLDLHFSCFCIGKPYPQQPMQMDWECLDTQIQSDHLQKPVQTGCLKDLRNKSDLLAVWTKPRRRLACCEDSMQSVINLLINTQHWGWRRQTLTGLFVEAKKFLLVSGADYNSSVVIQPQLQKIGTLWKT